VVLAAMSIWKHIRAILLLPGMVTIVIPATILHFSGMHGLSPPWNFVLPVTGSILVLVGLTLVAWTVRLFITVGKGTLAPWNPTQKLLVRGVYRHVRNPMITGVSCILLGEAVCLGSPWLLGWFGVFVAVNMIYIPLGEEPGLVKRFGDDYARYRENVPRWIPRLTPWDDWSGKE
jgi:protein-S-isoprenylcysteine O-methyltransferase Ste14